MRLLIVLLTLIFVITGAVFGALNSDWITLDFYARAISVPKGASLLVAVLTGWLLGGMTVWLARVPALKRELRRVRQRVPAPVPPKSAIPPAGKAADE